MAVFVYSTETKRILATKGQVKVVLGTYTQQVGYLESHKYKEGIKIDRENGKTLWMDAIKLEMQNVRIAFEDFDGARSKHSGGLCSR